MPRLALLLLAGLALAPVEQVQLKLALKADETLSVTHQARLSVHERPIKNAKEYPPEQQSSSTMTLTCAWVVKTPPGEAAGLVQELCEAAAVTFNSAQGAFSLERRGEAWTRDEVQGDEAIQRRRDQAKQGIADGMQAVWSLTASGAMSRDGQGDDEGLFDLPPWLPDAAVAVDDTWAASDGELSYEFKLEKIETIDHRRIAFIVGQGAGQRRTLDGDLEFERKLEVQFAIDDGLPILCRQKRKETATRSLRGAPMKQVLSAEVETRLARSGAR